MNVDPKTIVDTRIQLHWASQLLSAAADAKLDKAEDDSHSNLDWDSASSSMVGRAGCSIDVNQFKLMHGAAEYPLQGQSLEAARHWLSESLSSDLSFRDYDMPDHPVSSGAAFSVETEQLNSISEWLAFAKKSLEPYGALRIWPHHFDLGFWNPGDDGKSVGGGFSLGDSNVVQPYFYLNPYGIERPDALPNLAAGHWTGHWFGAVLTAEEMGNAGERAEIVQSYLDSASNEVQKLIG